MDDKKGLSRKEFLNGIGLGLVGLTVGGLLGGTASGGEAPVVPAQPAPGRSPLPFSFAQRGRHPVKTEKLGGIAYDHENHLTIARGEGIEVLNVDRGGADPAGATLRLIKTSGPACAVAVDPEGNIYAAQRTRIEKFDPQGTRTAAWGEKGDGPGQFRFITGLAASSSEVFICDSGARKIHRFAADGDFIDEMTGYNIPQGNPACGPIDPEPTEKGFLIPSGYFDCALDAHGLLYVGHTGQHRVERYDANGKLVGWWGKFGSLPEDFCGCCNPTNLAVFPDGRVATTEKGVPRLKVYDPAGKMLAFLGEESFPGNTAGMDLAIDSQGRIALAEPIKKEIRFYELRKN